MVALVQAQLKDPGLAISKTVLVGFHLCTYRRSLRNANSTNANSTSATFELVLLKSH